MIRASQFRDEETEKTVPYQGQPHSLNNEWASQEGLAVKNPTVSAGDISRRFDPWGSGRSPAKGHGNPLQDPCLGNPMDRGAWWAKVHRGAESDTTEAT